MGVRFMALLQVGLLAGILPRAVYAESCPPSIAGVVERTRPHSAETAESQEVTAQSTVGEIPATRSPLDGAPTLPPLVSPGWIDRVQALLQWRGEPTRLAPRAPRPEPQVYYESRPLSHRNRQRIEGLRAERRFQEVAWLYRELGFESLARDYEQYLETLLSRYTADDIANWEPLSGDGAGRSETVRVTFRDGTVAYFKPSAELQATRIGSLLANHRAEIAAFRFDQLLAANLVPTTVETRLRGRIGSLQVGMVPGGDPTFGSARLTWRMRLLDFLMGNTDRHSRNYLWGSSTHRLVAIDHGLSFHEPMHDELLVRDLLDSFLQERAAAVEREGVTGDAVWDRVYAETEEFRRALQSTPFEEWSLNTVILETLGPEEINIWYNMALANIRNMIPDVGTYRLLQRLDEPMLVRELGDLISPAQIQGILRRRNRILRLAHAREETH